MKFNAKKRIIKLCKFIKKGGITIKSTGIFRRIDSLGRIVIPIELRKSLKFQIGADVEISVENGCVVLKKAEDSCTVCNANNNLLEFKDKLICRHCVNEINNTFKGY